MLAKWRHLAQFSLKSLLAMMAAIAIWLAPRANKAIYQREIVREIKRLGGDVFYDYEGGPGCVGIDGSNDSPCIFVSHSDAEPPGPALLPTALRAEIFADIVEIYACEDSVKDSTIERLKLLQNLRRLTIYAPDATTEAIAGFRRDRPECPLIVYGRGEFPELDLTAY